MTTPPVDDAALQAIRQDIRDAAAAGTPLCIRGGGSKAFLGGPEVGEVLDTRPLAGISSYEPTELVVTARAGTPLAELEAVLAEKGQCLAFEPPHFAGAAGQSSRSGASATVGGMVASGLAGPARAAVGSVRDFVLGATLVDGRGEVLTFGGQVMKNVAGYDVSRLAAGSLGVLGVVAEVSLKVLPVAPATATLRFQMDQAAALAQLNAWAGRPLPLNASAWWEGSLLVRLRGAVAAVQAAIVDLGGDPIAPELAIPFWHGLREQTDEFFAGARAAVAGGAALWRLALPPTAAPVAAAGEQLVEWGGAQRWLCTPMPATRVRELAAASGGHATLWWTADADARAAGVFAPLAAPLARIHRELKKAFDPAGVFNRGRLYPDF